MSGNLAEADFSESIEGEHKSTVFSFLDSAF